MVILFREKFKKKKLKTSVLNINYDYSIKGLCFNANYSF